MLELFNKISLRTRMLLLAGLPLGVAILFSLNVALSARTTSNEFDDLSRLTSYAPFVSGTIHELQKERGRSAGFIAARGAPEVAQFLQEQRRETDDYLVRFEQATLAFDHERYGEGFEQQVKSARDLLSSLGETRRTVDAEDDPENIMAGSYTETIDALLNIIINMALLSDDAGITKDITAYIGLLESKERAAQELAVGYAGYTTGFSGESLDQFSQLVAAQDAFLISFRIFAPEAAAAYYDETVSGQFVAQVEEMRVNALENYGDVLGTGYEASFWFDNISGKLDLVKNVEDLTNANIAEKASAAAASSARLFWILSVLILIGSAAILAESYLTFISIYTPLNNLEKAMTVLADGDLAVKVPHTDLGSEIGLMANAVFAFKENGIERLKLEAEQKEVEEQRAKDRAANKAETEKRQEAERQRELEDAREQERRGKLMANLTAKFEGQASEAIAILSSASQELEATSGSMSSLAEQTGNESNAVASASEQASQNVQTVAAAAEEMAMSISEVSRQVSESESISAQALSEADNAVDTVAMLTETSNKVGAIVSLINDIAEQTNLLALNATIEAARAGDAGRGFAVVASEVKSLATQTASATDEISDHIKKIQDVSGDVRSAVDGIRAVILQTSEISVSVASAVEQQGSATHEISRNVQEASQGTQRVSDSITIVRNNAEETQRSSTQVLGAAKELATSSSDLKSVIDTFLEQVRAV